MMISSFITREDNQSDITTFWLTAKEVRVVQTVLCTDLTKYMKNPSSSTPTASNDHKGVQSSGHVRDLYKQSTLSGVFEWFIK